MTHEVADRIAWAVETLAVKASEQLLEIGCGAGVAMSAWAAGATTADPRTSHGRRFGENQRRRNTTAGRSAR